MDGIRSGADRSGQLRQYFRRLRRILRKVANELRDRSFVSVLPIQIREEIESVREDGLTYLSRQKLEKLAGSLLWVEARRIPGQVIEAGCALGGSTIILAHAKSPERPLLVHDVFGTIPPPSERDGSEVHERYATIAAGKARGLRGGAYYGYQADLLERVIDNIERHGLDLEADHISLRKGLVEDTLSLDQPVAFAHIDVDWYEPVMTCLERIVPRLEVGGIVILDDYYDWSGCRIAVDEYFADRAENFRFDGAGGSLAIVRIR